VTSISSPRTAHGSVSPSNLPHVLSLAADLQQGLAVCVTILEESELSSPNAELLAGGPEWRRFRMRKVKGYFISTCGWCKKTKWLLDENEIDYEYEYVDLLSPSEKARALAEVSQYNPHKSFPTVVVANDRTEVVIGFKEDRLREVLGL